MTARKKPVQKPVRPPQGGAAIIPGNPGNAGGKRGRSGRKTDDFKAACAALADNEVLATVTAYLRSKKPRADDPWFWKCAEYVTNYGKGKPPQNVIVGQDDDAPPFRFTMDLNSSAEPRVDIE